jgi:hypothetical protein
LATISANFGQNSKAWIHGDFTGEGLVAGGDLAWYGPYSGEDWRNLMILGDYDGDFDLQADDETDFLVFYNAQNLNADLNDDQAVTQADHDAFYELFNFGIDLDVA